MHRNLKVRRGPGDLIHGFSPVGSQYGNFCPVHRDFPRNLKKTGDATHFRHGEQQLNVVCSDLHETLTFIRQLFEIYNFGYYCHIRFQVFIGLFILHFPPGGSGNNTAKMGRVSGFGQKLP